MKYAPLVFFLVLACSTTESEQTKEVLDAPYVIVLGTVQDAGSPQAGCKKECCKHLFDNPDYTRKVTSLGLVDPISKETWLFEATPDLPAQQKILTAEIGKNEAPNGVFLTHAHIGHYTGLMYLGHESMGAENVPVYTMPRMKEYLESNGPWSQLVNFKNIDLKKMAHDSSFNLNKRIKVTPFLVPHRDEYSETVGYRIETTSKSLLFIPDINKWNIWERSIVDEIAKVDYAFLDATFYDNNEVNRDMSEIPHPFVQESMDLFKDMTVNEKTKVHFIHFNHTNPLLNSTSEEFSTVKNLGYQIAEFKQIISLD